VREKQRETEKEETVIQNTSSAAGAYSYSMRKEKRQRRRKRKALRGRRAEDYQAGGWKRGEILNGRLHQKERAAGHKATGCDKRVTRVAREVEGWKERSRMADREGNVNKEMGGRGEA
jgi:hypothetical protein